MIVTHRCLMFTLFCSWSACVRFKSGLAEIPPSQNVTVSTVGLIGVISHGEADVFTLSGCISEAVISSTFNSGDGTILFRGVPEVPELTPCVLEISDSQSDKNSDSAQTVTWTSRKGLRYQDKNVLLTKKTDGSRVGHALALQRMFEFKHDPDSQGTTRVLSIYGRLSDPNLKSGRYDALLICDKTSSELSSVKWTDDDMKINHGKAKLVLVFVGKLDHVPLECHAIQLFQNGILLASGALSPPLSFTWLSAADNLQLDKIIDFGATNVTIQIEPKIGNP